MKKVEVVIGLNYGDEGKGKTVDFLADRSDSDSLAVVRFNGGAQAGHTVEANGERHIFSHIGSGTFAGADTVLSRFFVVNPVLFMQEIEKLHRRINIYVDPFCYVTTPYDVLINRLREKRRKHGSVGVGFNETITRNLEGFPLVMRDLKDLEYVKDILRDIRYNYYYPIARKLEQDRPDITSEWLDDAETRFLDDCKWMMKFVKIVRDQAAFDYFDHLIFEGAQGLRLDQYSQDFPHVTRSSTGLENVAALLRNFECDVTTYYVTRSYLTRHGFGPLDGEIDNPGIEDRTNINNQYQDHLRFANHDYLRMQLDAEKDQGFLQCNKCVAVITWCDKEKLFTGDLLTKLQKIKRAVGTEYYMTSWGPGRRDMKDHGCD